PHGHDHRGGAGAGRDRAAAAHRHERLRRGGPGNADGPVERAARPDLSLAGQREPELLRGADIGRHHGPARADAEPERHRHLPPPPPGATRMSATAQPETSGMHMTSETAIIEQAALASGMGGTIRTPDETPRELRVKASDVNVFYGAKRALYDV